MHAATDCEEKVKTHSITENELQPLECPAASICALWSPSQKAGWVGILRKTSMGSTRRSPHSFSKPQATTFFVSDIRLDWQTFNYPSSDDHKLVDLNIWFGEAFPLKKPKARQSVGGRSKASYSSSSLMLLNSAPKVNSAFFVNRAMSKLGPVL